MRASPGFRAALMMAAILCAVARPAAAVVIVAEDFNHPDGTNMNGATPDVANLPGGIFRASQPSWVTQANGNQLKFGADVSLNAPLGNYFTGLLHVSADISLGSLIGSVGNPNRGIGVGFNSGAAAQWNSFTGLRLAPDGNFQFESYGSNVATLALPGIKAGVLYGLHYDVNVDTGVLSNIAISGVNADYSAITAASRQHNYFGGANNVAIFAGGTAGGQYGYADNLSLSNDTVVPTTPVVVNNPVVNNNPVDAVPEPASFGILAFGIGSLWMVRRRRGA